MSKIPTAEELIEKQEKGFLILSKDEWVKIMKKFTKLHVQAALKAAHTNAKIVKDTDPQPFGGPFIWVDEESILSAYPLTNIK